MRGRRPGGGASGGGLSVTSGESQGRGSPGRSPGGVHSETPCVLGGGKGTNRQISMRGFEDTTWFPKTLKPSSSVAARRLERVSIFAKGASGACKCNIAPKTLV